MFLLSMTMNFVHKQATDPRKQKENLSIFATDFQAYHAPPGSAPAILLLALVAPFSFSSTSFPRFLFVVASTEFAVMVSSSVPASTAFFFAGAFLLDAAGVPLDFAVKAKGLAAAGFATGFTAGFLMRFAGVGLATG